MSAINELLEVMKNLRDPENGCPWDRAQTIKSISGYTLEEAYELVESIENEDMPGLCDELGDLLFHIVFYAEMANESDFFDFETICARASAKLKRRHPHVFAEKEFGDRKSLEQNWEQIKQQERKEKEPQQRNGTGTSLLSDIGGSFPALIRAEKLQKRAASVGFDWSELTPVFAKIEEELAEVKQAVESSNSEQAVLDEFGDLLFSCVNLGRHLGVQAESALRQTNLKFLHRFDYIEQRLKAEGMELNEANAERMEEFWQEAKNSDP
ncbi:MAG: nucleoside triphosphate pyrophosphohydrolase [Gammaproteobacteria bacterium]|nr:nucleoside triphosphate pyrophosphohydrolase [Gammaproteobacteria bacterium]